MRSLLILAAACAVLAAPASAAEPAPKALSRGGQLMDQALAAFDTDKEKSRALMEASAATGYVEAVNGLAMYYFNGIGGPEDRAKALALYEQAVKSGSAPAKLNLGRILIFEHDKAKQERGFRLLQEASAVPDLHRPAMVGLGLAYEFGNGVARDLKHGADLLEEADPEPAADGQAAYMLARTYQQGWGGRPVDYTRAYRLFRLSASAGTAHAGWEAGMMLINGQGVAKDEAEAYRLVRQAAEDGDRDGQISTGVMLAIGQGVAENDVESRAWYLKAAEQGSTHALRELGGMYLRGEGGAVDEATALAYLELAAEAGDTQAQKAIKSLGFSASPQGRAHLDTIKKAWIAAHGAPQVDGD